MTLSHVKNFFSRAKATPSKAIGTTPLSNEHCSEKMRLADTRYDCVLPGKRLLAQAAFHGEVEKIKRQVAATASNWDEHYYPALEAAALFAQTMPASRNHHHADAGGLLKHLLDVCNLAMRLSKAEVLPPESAPEKILLEGERWRFALFIAALCHDIGKVAADMEIAFSAQQGAWQHWDPLFGPMPIGARFCYRYPTRRAPAKSTKSLHELIGLALLPNFLTQQTSRWLRSDPALMSEMLGAIVEVATGTGTINRLLRAADQGSVAAAITNEHSANGIGIAPKHQRILKTLQELAKREEMKRNVPGGMLWVHPTGTWLVKGSGLELITKTMRQRGDDAIPQSKDLIADILSENQVTIPHPNTHSTWQAVIKIPADNWEQKLTCLRFNHEDIWGPDVPSFIEAEITDHAGVELTHLPIPTRSGTDIEALDLETATPRTTQSSVAQDVTHPVDPLQDTESSSEESQPPAHQHSRHDSNEAPIPAPPAVAEPTKKQQKEILTENRSLIAKSDFFAWLLEGISDLSVRINEPNALVHVVDGHMALVTPAVFKQFVERTSLCGGQRDPSLIRSVQAEIKRLKLHQKNAEGGDVFCIHINGQHRKSAINAFLFPLSNVHGLNHLANNPVMKLPETLADTST